jgi:hypothetical protein
MNNKDLENKIYEYGEVMKHIGRCETDGKVGMKEYNKLINEKEKLIKFFDDYFQTNLKVKKTLPIT